MADIRSSWKWRPAGRFPMLIRALQRLCFVALLTAAIAVGKTAAQSERDALMAGRGTVSFPVSCNANLQPRFDAALAALHSFWYGQALKEFTAIAEADPECAMAYWGTAMSVWNQLWAPPRANNLERGLDAIEKARLITRKSPRESDYIEALAVFYSDTDKLDHATRAAAYARKMEELAQRYPEDPEAEIFYALALLASADPLDKTYKNQLKAGAMLEKLFAEMPGHPGVSHYIIHAYDYPALADRAVAAALNYAVCVTIVPQHSDMCYASRPPRGSMLYALEIPELFGLALGDTEFASTAAAWDALPERMRQHLDGCRAVFDFAGRKRAFPPTQAEIDRYPPVTHPIVRTHPVTRRKCVYAMRDDCTGIEGREGRQAETLIAALADHIVKPAFVYRHQWRVGDLLMWDNCTVQHRAIQDYDLPQRRLMHRTTMGGIVPL